MRETFKKALLIWLKTISRAIIRKYQPHIIAITGSYGKTTTKEAIYAALHGVTDKRLRKTQGNLNSQWGLPLTVLGVSDPQGSLARYLLAGLKGLGLLLIRQRSYPEILILEMGADKPGDIAYLLTIARPDIAVLTGIGETHLELFGSLEQVAQEKARLIQALGERGQPRQNRVSAGIAVVNYDDERTRALGETGLTRYLTYGLREGSDLTASQIRLELNDLPAEQATAPGVLGGTSFSVSSAGTFGRCYLPDVAGLPHVYSSLAALSVAKALSLDLAAALASLRDNYDSPPGRMRLLPGIKQTFLLDDSYNSSPQAAVMALETLADLAIQGQRWAVLGDMLELGVRTEELHRKLGQRLQELQIGYLITIGERAHHIAHGAIDAGKSKNTVFEFDEPGEAGRFLQDRMQKNDLILIKGSRGVHLEKIVKEVMAQPEKADELLVH